jgi:hypothetical protein
MPIRIRRVTHMMKWGLLFTVLIFSLILIVGCTNNEKMKIKDDHHNVRKVAWDFIDEKGWNDRAKGDWGNAIVTKSIVNSSAELIEKNYTDQKVFFVTFHEKENVVVGVPVILVDIQSNKVIGYIPVE